MEPIDFPNSNVVFGANQEGVQALPAHRDKKGIVTTVWQLTPEERLEIFNSGKLAITIATDNKSLQPILPIVLRDGILP